MKYDMVAFRETHNAMRAQRDACVMQLFCYGNGIMLQKVTQMQRAAEMSAG